MDNKKIVYIVGGVAVLGIAYYLFNKNKLKASNETDDAEVLKPAPAPAPAPAPNIEKPPVEKLTVENPPVEKAMVKKLTSQELEMELQKGCGKKPKLKKNIALYNKCRENLTAKLRTQGMISFEGTYSYEDVVGDNFFSSFNSNFDLNL